MPGPVSDRKPRPGPDTPYVPPWCYPHGKPKMCPCGHHEGFHNDAGECLQRHKCNCTGLPADCVTTVAIE